ncbi:Protein gts1 [Elasticomyces elasticus]|uniref:Protein gts1 n=1 Tax=Exophiala sideris TaxID=1016849 RepID=A0ABR0J3R3_9EURO|nr:Protein gts1 [Elasticomyces elasticus]KAK5024154.1 Protein gts1 [Exophiala sideris]KAK5028986.1 Protein gts1 [Exophiala sideris]KAK5054866.1 Protein gts1 [Exophiala sideris]KAK5178809.1 Protein gts1 [Eurotiomycetes sp. CCFEE 6388]
MASMSKRTQARNERELHELLNLPGNSQCADCGAKNPAWASWNLGVFLCMRCASLHRKLGTHISKVKSLSMDTWNTEQVENMKRNGNDTVNKTYNPKNKKPDMPLDADEVDSAMERFIRKKYQEKSLSDGKPQPPQRDDHSRTSYSRPQREESPPPPLPPKKGKLFGFSLRASASSLQLSSKRKAAKEPRIDRDFHVPDDDYNSMSRMADARYEIADADLQKKLNALLDMGFSDVERNTSLLKKLNGNVERTIATLIQLGSSENTRASTTQRPERSTSGSIQAATGASTTETTAQRPAEPSYNPFAQMTNQQTVGLSMSNSQEPNYGSNNPYGQANRGPTESGLEQSFQTMQLAQPLFPHSTGGYPSQHASLQDPRFLYSMTPPVPSTNFQQGYTASPAAVPMPTNPFFQSAPVSTQSTGNNPFLPQPAPSSPSTNPFFGFQPAQAPQTQQRQSSLPASLNPFGIPPSQSVPQPPQQPFTAQSASQTQDLFGTVQQNLFVNHNNPFQAQQQQPQMQNPVSQTPTGFPNFQYGQSQTQPQSQPQPQPPHFQQQTSYQPQFSQQPQQLMPQQTGRHDKNSIMALYNYPQLAPQQLASIPEPSDTAGQQVVSPTPSGDVYGQGLTPTKRSATMPVSLSHMHSAGGGGSRNPFLMNTVSTNANANVGVSSPPPGQAQTQQGIAARHASRESMLISGLESGRHSPDAFANLSARYR